MRVITCLIAALVGLTVLGGCATGPGKELSRIFERKGEPQFQQGIRNYEDGRLQQASANFQSALEAGLNNADQVKAHKYLAFIDCVGGRDRQCRAHFRSALELDPAFELAPAEAGHPTWGPVFRSVKGRR